MNEASGNNQDLQDEEWSPDELIPFGKYILLDRINSGATAAVYRANVRGEAGFERLVAIKRILPHMAGDRDFVDTFVREAKTVARLTHAGICPIYELGKVGESLYMAIEYVQGRDLGHITRRLAKRGETMPPVIAAWIAARLCESLDYAHNLKNAAGQRVGILHRDLSPTNILVSYEGQVKLIDFGLAKAVGRAQSTNVDALKRKLGYMSPEMVKGRPLDARSDIFGVGVSLYEMLTSRRLFSGANDIDTLKLVGKALVPPPSAIVDDAPEELEIIVMHALEREPEDRFQSADEMGAALGAYLQKADPTFNSQKLSAWMHELFGEDIVNEQQRIKRLLAASADPELIKRRKAFFASPTGAAARARAEIERRMSTEPPPVMGGPPHATVPRAAALPKEAARKAADARDTTPRSMRPEAAASARTGQPAPFDEEPTAFYDADKTKAGTPSGTPFEEEPTSFYDGDRTRSADLDKTRAVDADKTRPAAPAHTAANLAASPFDDDEPTQFIVDTSQLEEVVSEPAPAPLPSGKPIGPFDFDEEPTEIFFNKEENFGVPEILEEINDIEQPSGGLNKPIVSADLVMPEPAPVAAPPARLARPTPQQSFGAPPLVAPPPAVVPAPVPMPMRGRAQRTTLEVHMPRRTPVWPLVAGGGAMVAMVALLIWLTPVGVALGIRALPTGAIEVRTAPEVAAEVQLDQVYRGSAPLRLDGVREGRRRLDIRAQGYLPVTREVEVRAGQTESLTITLVPDRPRPTSSTTLQGTAPQPGASAAPPQQPSSPVPGVVLERPQNEERSGGSRRPERRGEQAQAPERERASEAPPPSSGANPTNGSLSATSVPWALVYVDGRDTGHRTPLMGYPLSPGPHEIRLQTATGHVYVERVTVRPGQTVQITKRF